MRLPLMLTPGTACTSGESSMWGDYHARELALLLLREATAKPYCKFFHATEKL